ncbi:MAG: hypothetical protein JSV33_11515 [bacterium]|nr:MAG: hypothetical protein JSV33_11515 [bacterium]
MCEQKNGNPNRDLLLADLSHFGESLWRNEEVGEKRFNFFLTLLTAVVAGLVALHTQGKDSLTDKMLKDVTNVAIAGLFLLGILTYLRTLRRNRVSDQFQRTLKHIRETLRVPDQAIEGYQTPQPLNEGRWGWFRGGLAETTGAMNALLLFGLLVINCVPVVLAGIISACVLLVLWSIAAPRKGVK